VVRKTSLTLSLRRIRPGPAVSLLILIFFIIYHGENKQLCVCQDLNSLHRSASVTTPALVCQTFTSIFSIYSCTKNKSRSSEAARFCHLITWKRHSRLLRPPCMLVVGEMIFITSRACCKAYTSLRPSPEHHIQLY
jgi:hypothetical protein